MIKFRRMQRLVTVLKLLSFKNIIPRSVALKKVTITAVDFHVFGDASLVKSGAVVYAIVHQSSITNQRLVVNKSHIARKNFIIPRLNFFSAHMTLNLIENVKAALKRCNIRSIARWTICTVILDWMKRQGLHKQFTAKRVSKILKKDYMKRYFVPTK